MSSTDGDTDNAFVRRLKMVISVNGAITLALAVCMLATGTVNTLTTKFQDQRIVKGFGDGPPTAFEHAFFQTGCMFLGELLCLFVYRLTVVQSFLRKKWNVRKGAALEGETESLLNQQSSNNTTTSIVNNLDNGDNGVSMDDIMQQQQDEKKEDQYINPLIFWIPACCDLGGTTLLNVGLFYTTASVYQMLRGTLVIFAGIMSVVFLKNRLYPHHWGGILLITVGTSIVGLSSFLMQDPDAPSQAKNPMLGNLLVISAQVLAAIQFIVEEKFFSTNKKIQPLQVVGWEGYFGLSMTAIMLFVLYWVPGSDAGSWENAPYAMAQILNDWPLMMAVCTSVCSIAAFNFFGLMVTKRVSSTTRATIDSMRTMFIWMVSLALGWERFFWLQVVGFVILVIGTFLYNEVIRIPKYQPWYVEHKNNWLAERERQAKEKEEEKRRKRFAKKAFAADGEF